MKKGQGNQEKILIGCPFCRRMKMPYLYYQKRCIFSIDNEWCQVISRSVSGWPGRSGKLTWCFWKLNFDFGSFPEVFPEGFHRDEKVPGKIPALTAES
jgi:hypothetical protein